MAFELKLTRGKSEPKSPKTANLVGKPPSFDLLPKSRRDQVEAIEARKLWTRIGVIAGGVTVVAIGAILALNIMTNLEYDRLLEEQADIDRTIASFSDVSQIVDIESNAEGLASRVAGNELNWLAIYEKLYSTLPSGSAIGGLYVSSGATTGVSAAVTVDIVSPSAMDFARVVEAFEDVEGTQGLIVSGITGGADADGQTFRYSIAFGFDQSILTNKWLVEGTDGLPGLGELAGGLPGSTEDPLGQLGETETPADEATDDTALEETEE